MSQGGRSGPGTPADRDAAHGCGAAPGRCRGRRLLPPLHRDSVDDLIRDLKARQFRGAGLGELCGVQRRASPRWCVSSRASPRSPCSVSSSCARRSAVLALGRGHQAPDRRSAIGGVARAPRRRSCPIPGTPDIAPSSPARHDLTGVPDDCCALRGRSSPVRPRTANVRLLARISTCCQAPDEPVLPCTERRRPSVSRHGAPRSRGAAVREQRLSRSRTWRTILTTVSPQSFGRHVRTLLRLTAGNSANATTAARCSTASGRSSCCRISTCSGSFAPSTSPPAGSARRVLRGHGGEAHLLGERHRRHGEGLIDCRRRSESSASCCEVAFMRSSARSARRERRGCVGPRRRFTATFWTPVHRRPKSAHGRRLRARHTGRLAMTSAMRADALEHHAQGAVRLVADVRRRRDLTLSLRASVDRHGDVLPAPKRLSTPRPSRPVMLVLGQLLHSSATTARSPAVLAARAASRLRSTRADSSAARFARPLRELATCSDAVPSALTVVAVTARAR